MTIADFSLLNIVLLIAFAASSLALASKCALGSSNKYKSAFFPKQIAILTACNSPPDSLFASSSSS